jgi:hypothetical protein
MDVRDPDPAFSLNKQTGCLCEALRRQDRMQKVFVDNAVAGSNKKIDRNILFWFG